jgi:DNA-directed RNA polymerase subunit RPC12/RpoP
MSFWEAKTTIRDYVCSACWDELDYIQHDKSNPYVATVFCHTCKEHTPGFVTRKYAERTAERNGQQFLEAKRALRDALPWLRVPVEATEAEILKRLGY